MLKKSAGLLYDIMEKKIDHSKTIQRIKRVHTCTDKEARERCRSMYVERIEKIFVVMIVSILVAVLLFVRSALASDVVALERPDYGGDTGSKTLQTEVEGRRTDFTVEVLPVEYDESQLEDVFANGFAEIEKVYLGENESADNIQMDMNLPERLDETGLDVAWISSDQEVITSSGKIHKKYGEDPELIKLTAVLSYGDKSAEREYEIRVMGKKISASEQAIQLITDYVRNLQKDNKDSRRVELPSEIEGYSVTDTSNGSGGISVVLLGIAAAVCIWMGAAANVSKLEKERKQQLMLDYPELVDKMTLYIGAGVTVRGAFVRIVQGKCGDALSRELKYTLNEIQAGVPESEAYYNMGHRINLPVYIKLMSMLSQNVNKGTRDIMVMMAGEEQAAIQARKELARKKGEEAGTKLLFPMIVLLGIVMVIVVLPAVMSF